MCSESATKRRSEHKGDLGWELYCEIDFNVNHQAENDPSRDDQAENNYSKDNQAESDHSENDQAENDHCEIDHFEIDHFENDQVEDNEAEKSPVRKDLQLSNVRISRFSDVRVLNPSGYNPTPEILRALQDEKTVHVKVDRHGMEYTWGARGDWRNYLSCKEMIKEQGFPRVLELAAEEPYRVLGWFNSVTPWGALPSPTNFRFGNPKFYIKLRKVVEQQLGISIKNRHPFYKVRGGKKNRRY